MCEEPNPAQRVLQLKSPPFIEIEMLIFQFHILVLLKKKNYIFIKF